MPLFPVQPIIRPNVAGFYANPSNMQVDSSGDVTSIVNGSGGGGSGTVTSITAGNGLSGGAITTSGTIALNNITHALGTNGPGYYNVKDFGAVCDGSTNDYTAIQNCINSAQSASPAITGIFIPGFCAIGTALTITSPLTLFGNGRGNCGLIQTNTTLDVVDITIASGNYGVTIRDLAITYNSSSTGVGIYIHAGSQAGALFFGHFIDRVLFLNCGTGLYVDGSSGSVVSNCMFWTGGIGIVWANSIDADNGDGTIHGCYFQYLTTCIYQLSGGGLKVCNNKFNTSHIGFYLNLQGHTVDLFINNNSFENSQSNSIYLTCNPTYPSPSPTTTATRFICITIGNNEIQTGGFGDPAIMVESIFATGLLTISGNAIQNAYVGPTGVGISLGGVQGFIIGPNTFGVFQGAGTMSAFYIDSSSTQGTITTQNIGTGVTLGTNNSTSTRTFVQDTPLCEPSNAFISNTTTTSISLTWAAGLYASSYLVSYRPMFNPVGLYSSTAVSGLSTTLSGLTSSVTYDIIVTSVTGLGTTSGLNPSTRVFGVPNNVSPWWTVTGVPAPDTYYPLKANFIDASGVYTLSTVSGSATPTFSSTSRGGAATQVSGTYQLVSTYNIGFSFTLSGWINLSLAANATLFGQIQSGSQRYYSVAFYTGSPYTYSDISPVASSFSTNKSSINSNTTISSGTWYHVCLTLDSPGNQILYINGNNVGSTTLVNPSLWNANMTATPLSIGGVVGQPSNYSIVGNYQDIAAWPYALTPSQVTSLYTYQLANP